MKIFDPTFSAIEKALDLNFKRHAVLVGNVANSETPNYRARELNFAGELARAVGKGNDAMEKTHPLHLDISTDERSHVVFDDSGAMGNNGNNVDLDIEMGKLSANARGYQNAASMLDMKLRLLRLFTRNRGGV